MPNLFSDPLEIENPPFQSLETRDFPAVTEAEITNPYYTAAGGALVEGEWVTVLSGANTGKIIRTDRDDPNPFLYLGQLGRTDLQVTKKAPISLYPPKIIKTKLVDGSGGLDVGDYVGVGAITYNTVANRSGLVLGVSGHYAVGKVLVKGTNTGAPDGKTYWTILLFSQPVLLP